MLIYLLKSAVCITLLYGVYWLFLKKDTFFTMNRIYLLGITLFSAVFPLIPFRWTPTGTAASLVYVLDPVLITPDKVEKASGSSLQWLEILGIVYITGVAIFLLRFAVQLIQLYLIVRRNGVRRREGIRLVCVDKGYSPFSFFNLVFINERNITEERLQAVLTHEKVHVQQMHTIDLILAEIFTSLQWFNPFAWLTGREMKAVHEYLADEGVLTAGVSRSQYQQMILDESMGIQVNGLTNNFNVSLLKKRILMISKVKSGKLAFSKFLLAVPVIVILGLVLSATSFGKTEAPQDNKSKTPTVAVPEPPPPPPPPPPASKDDGSIAQAAGSKTVVLKEPKEAKVYQKVDVQPEYPGGQEAMVKFILENLKYPKEAIEKNVQGKVIVNFIVWETGSVGDVKVVQGIGSGCDEEAVRVVKLMPKWTPGKNGGKPVAVNFYLPFNFKFDGNKNKEEPKK